MWLIIITLYQTEWKLEEQQEHYVYTYMHEQQNCSNKFRCLMFLSDSDLQAPAMWNKFFLFFNFVISLKKKANASKILAKLVEFPHKNKDV